MQITLSTRLSQALSSADVEDTLRHEIAHAIDAERRGRSRHDRTWKALAVACGAVPERCFTGDLPHDPQAPYLATCPSCSVRHRLYRQPATLCRCSPCLHAERPAFLRVVHVRTGRVIWPGGAERGVYGGTAGVEATCPGCGDIHRRARRPTRDSACVACCRRHAAGRYDARFRLRYR